MGQRVHFVASGPNAGAVRDPLLFWVVTLVYNYCTRLYLVHLQTRTTYAGKSIAISFFRLGKDCFAASYIASGNEEQDVCRGPKWKVYTRRQALKERERGGSCSTLSCSLHRPRYSRAASSGLRSQDTIETISVPMAVLPYTSP